MIKVVYWLKLSTHESCLLMKVVYWWTFLLMKVRIVIFWPSDCFVARKYCNNLLINKMFVVIEIIKGFQSTTKTGGCRGRIWRLSIEYEGCLCIWRLSSPVYNLHLFWIANIFPGYKTIPNHYKFYRIFRILTQISKFQRILTKFQNFNQISEQPQHFRIKKELHFPQI